MKLTEIFNRKQAAGTFAAEPPIFGEVPDHRQCNCLDEATGLFSPEEATDLRQQFENGTDRDRIAGHGTILKRILEVASRVKPGETSNGAVDILSGLKLKDPAAVHDFGRHIITHMDAAGLSPQDFGIQENELSGNYTSGRQAAGRALTGPVSTTETAGAHNCGVCGQYSTEIRNKMKDAREGMKKIVNFLPAGVSELGSRSMAQTLKDAWRTWSSGGKISGDTIKNFEGLGEIQKLFSQWNKHTRAEHGTFLHTLRPGRAPVVPDSDNFFDYLYDQHVGSKQELPESVTREPQPGDQPKRWLTIGIPNSEKYETALEGITPETSEYDVAAIANELVKQKIIQKQVVKPSGERPFGDVSPSATMAGVPQLMVETPLSTAVGWHENEVGPYNRITVEHKNPPLTYNSGQEFHPDTAEPLFSDADLDRILDNDRPEITGFFDDNGTMVRPEHLKDLSRRDAFLFQRARMMPDLASHRAYQRALIDYNSQPSHRDTGKKVMKNVPKKEKDRFGNWNEVRDADGNTVMEPVEHAVLERIPDSERLPEPSRQKATEDYSRSFNRALQAVYPDVDLTSEMSWLDALSRLEFEHADAVNVAEKAKTKAMRLHRTSSVEETSRTTFNSSSI